MPYYECEHFNIKELVDQNTYAVYGERAWQFLQVEALKGLDDLREYFDRPVWVNTWSFGGDLQFRGYRPGNCSVGAVRSQHRAGNAWDCNIEDITAEEARAEILKNKNHKKLKRITTIEGRVTWLHFDFRNIPTAERIRIVKP
jgi:hypothetical protein